MLDKKVKELPQDDFVQEVQLQTAEKYILFEANYAKIPYFGVATTKLDVDLLQAADGAYSLSSSTNSLAYPVSSTTFSISSLS